MAGKTRDPGAPVGKDEIDPELVSLRGPRAKVGAITALAIVVLCGFYLLKLLGDFTFSHQPDKPRDVSVADVVAGKVGTDELVQVTATVERSAAVRVRTGQGDPGVRVAPVVGSDDKLWIALPGDPWQPSIDGRYRGRLHAASAGPLGKALRDYLEAPQPRFVAGLALAKARLASASGADLQTVDGAKIHADATTPVEIDVVDPGAARVVVTFTEKYKDVKAWTDALAAAGVIAPGTAPGESLDGGAAWLVRAPDAVTATEAKLEQAELWATRVDPVTVSRKATWKDLGATPSELTIGDAKLPWSAVDVAALWVPRPVPDGAYVLVVDEKPSDYWAVKPLYIALGVIGLLFLWALVRAVRRDLMPPAK
jgi:hypothetical protein